MTRTVRDCRIARRLIVSLTRRSGIDIFASSAIDLAQYAKMVTMKLDLQSEGLHGGQSWRG